MYGLIGNCRAIAGKRDELAACMLENVSGMPGCLAYVVALDPEDGDRLWITEVWVDQASHRASLEIPAVKETIARAKPLIAEFGEFHVTTPVGGHGLASRP